MDKHSEWIHCLRVLQEASEVLHKYCENMPIEIRMKTSMVITDVMMELIRHEPQQPDVVGHGVRVHSINKNADTTPIQAMNTISIVKNSNKKTAKVK